MWTLSHVLKSVWTVASERVASPLVNFDGLTEKRNDISATQRKNGDIVKV